MVPGVTAKAPWHSVGRAVCEDIARMLLWNGAGVRRLARSRRWIRSGTGSDTGGGRPMPMFAAAVPLPWKRGAEQLVNRTHEAPASAETRVLVSPTLRPSSPVGLFLVKQ